MLTVPPKLHEGAHVRVVAPSSSLSIVADDVRAIADARLHALGLRVSFGRHVDERDRFNSTSISSRCEDLHDAFADDSVDAILTVLGGFNANQLLDHLDWDLIAAHPKIFCGYSDITALQNAMLTRSSLVTYSGPHYATFGMRDHFDQTLEWFRACLFHSDAMQLQPASEWSNDAWFVDQDDRTVEPNEGWWVLQDGAAQGRLVGGNLCTVKLLQGTPFMPHLSRAIVFVEDDAESQPHHFDRDLQSLLHHAGGDQVQGLVIGRFERASRMTRDLLEQIVSTKRQLRGVPVVANVDFGHTDPLLTFPVGGHVSIAAKGGHADLRVTQH